MTLTLSLNGNEVLQKMHLRHLQRQQAKNNQWTSQRVE